MPTTINPPNILHLYRSLLREASYLADPNSRVYIRNHVIRRFRRYLPKYEPREKITPRRQKHLLTQARKFHSTLRRSNEGYVGPYDRVLKLTYGRTGRRKGRMVERITQSANRQDLGDIAAQNGTVVPKKYYPGWQPPPMMVNLLKSMSAHSNHLNYPSAKIRPALPELPEKNIWHRPMPVCRIKNKNHRWFTAMSRLMLPPLPQKEWSSLRSLAIGTQPLPAILPRRKPATISLTTPIADSTTATAAAAAAAAELFATDSTSNMILNGPTRSPTVHPQQTSPPLSTPSPYKLISTLGHPHKLTQRFRRRRLAFVLQHTPVVHAVGEGEKSRLLFQWDSASQNKPSLRMGKPNDTQKELLFG